VFRGHQPSETGFIMGHEFAGHIVEAGSGVKTVAVGDKIVCPFTVSWYEFTPLLVMDTRSTMKTKKWVWDSHHILIMMPLLLPCLLHLTPFPAVHQTKLHNLACNASTASMAIPRDASTAFSSGLPAWTARKQSTYAYPGPTGLS